LTGRTHQVNGNPVYSLGLIWDNSNQIVSRAESLLSSSQTYNYAYDADGQIQEVKKNGGIVESYTYDLNGNRTSGGASYEFQDRLTQLGGIVYGFNADGYLTSRGGESFVYSARGELVQATVGTKTVEYAYDGFNRLAARKDSTGTTQFFFGQPGKGYELTAVKSPAGEITEYLYDHNGGLFALRRAGTWYYGAGDQVGSPRAVIRQDGTVIKTREYDGYGKTLSDSAPSIDLPIGFAGGVQDQITGLVRFGLRDYEPASGRWTARDPILFKGGQPNLYAYVSNNPVNLVDPSGTANEGGGFFSDLWEEIKEQFRVQKKIWGMVFRNPFTEGWGLPPYTQPSRHHAVTGVLGKAEDVEPLYDPCKPGSSATAGIIF
jgi:RHS repeat-associated protein